MDWKICAAEDLRRYRHMKLGIKGAKERLKTIRLSARGLRNSLHKTYLKTDTEYVNMIVESERLNANIKLCENLLGLIERGLNSLTEEERAVLEKFYMTPGAPNLIKLKTRFGYESRSIYRLRDTALEKFTLAMYGICES